MAMPEAIEKRRNKDIESRIKGELSGIVPVPLDVVFMGAVAKSREGEGSTSTEEKDDFSIDDRAVRVQIERNDDGCEWAYENEVAVYNNIERLDNTFNNGFVSVVFDKYKKDPKKDECLALLNRKKDELMLQKKLSVLIKNRALYGFGLLSKIKKGNDIVGLLELDCNEERCKPLYNLQKGDLGVDVKGIGKNIAIIQKGKVANYDADGIVSHTNKDFYFERENILYINNNDRGKFKGTSPVRRILRLVEIKKTFENSVDLLIKRFGPQIWIMVGNKDYNLGNTRIPADYLRGSDGNLVPESEARANYRNAIFDDINSKIQKWAKGETLVQIAEFGTDVKTLQPNTNLWQYSRYIDLFADYIKVGIFGLDVAGRLDVTSAIMQDRLYRDLKDKARKERAYIITTFNNEIAKEVLKANGFPEDMGGWEFYPIDKVEDEQDARTERIRSETIRNYKLAGVNIPENLIEKWNLPSDVNENKNDSKVQRWPVNNNTEVDEQGRRERQRKKPSELE